MGKSRDQQVVDALFKQAVGFTEVVQKTQKCKHIEYDERGKKTSEVEVCQPYEEPVYVKPSVVAQRFWLSNRLPDKWGTQVDANATENGEIDFPALE